MALALSSPPGVTDANAGEPTGAVAIVYTKDLLQFFRAMRFCTKEGGCRACSGGRSSWRTRACPRVRHGLLSTEPSLTYSGLLASVSTGLRT